MKALMVGALLVAMFFICRPTVEGFDGNPDTTTTTSQETTR